MVEFIIRKLWSESFRLSSFSDNAEAVLCVSRLLRYPYPLPKSVLNSLAPHHIPVLIGFLGWLAELAFIDKEKGIGPATTKNDAGGDDDDDKIDVDRVWLKYLTDSFCERRNPEKLQAVDERFEEQLQLHVMNAETVANELSENHSELVQKIESLHQKTDENNIEAERTEQQAAEKNSDLPKLQELTEDLERQRDEYEILCEEKVDECTKVLMYVRNLEKNLKERESEVAQLGISESSRSSALSEKEKVLEELGTVQKVLDSRKNDVERAKYEFIHDAQQLNTKIVELRSNLMVQDSNSDGDACGKSANNGISNLSQDPETGLIDIEDLISMKKSLKEITKRELKQEIGELIRRNAEIEKGCARQEESVARLEAEVASMRKTLESRKEEMRALERNLEREASGLKADASEYEATTRRARAESREIVDNAIGALSDARKQHEDALKGEGHDVEAFKESIDEYIMGLYSLSEAMAEHKDSVEKALQYLKEQSENVLITFERDAAEEENEIKKDELD